MRGSEEKKSEEVKIKVKASGSNELQLDGEEMYKHNINKNIKYGTQSDKLQFIVLLISYWYQCMYNLKYYLYNNSVCI